MPIRACSGAAVAGYAPARKKRARAQSASAARRRRAMLIPPSDRGSGFFVAMDEARRRQRRLAHRLSLLGPAHRDGEIVQPPVMDAVDQPVHLEGLAAPPGLLHDRGVADIVDLLDDVDLAQDVGLRRHVGFRRDDGLVLLAQRADAVEPVVDEAELVALERRLDAAAAVMAADDDMGDAQHVDGVLHHRQAVEVDMHDLVGDVAVDEDLAGQEADHLVGGHPAVRAADPQELGRLLVAQLGEEAGMLLLHVARPFPVILDQAGYRVFPVRSIHLVPTSHLRTATTQSDHPDCASGATGGAIYNTDLNRSNQSPRRPGAARATVRRSSTAATAPFRPYPAGVPRFRELARARGGAAARR